jgi:hypothetical protein
MITFHKNIPSYGIIYPSLLEISMSVGTKGIQIGRFGLAELRITSLQSRIIVKVNDYRWKCT